VAAAERGEQALVCASCNPDGGPPMSNAMFARSALRVASAPSPRPVSENGEYVFFDSEDALVPGAQSGVLHVYEWHGGKIFPISAAGAATDSFFLGSDATGENVFFGTYSQLVSQDQDQASDLYDARVDGGFEGLAPPACTGTGCQGVPGAPPIFATPSSVTFAGIGNFPPSASTVAKKVTKKTVKCKKGFVKNKKGKCIPKKKKKSKAKKSAHTNRRAK
jgi:hypothetical protein